MLDRARGKHRQTGARLHSAVIALAALCAAAVAMGATIVARALAGMISGDAMKKNGPRAGIHAERIDVAKDPHVQPDDPGVQPDHVSLAGLAASVGVVLAALGLLLFLLRTLPGGHAAAEASYMGDSAASTGRLPRARTADALRSLRAHEDSLLNSYGWADSAAGKVRAPVAEAMERAVREGLIIGNGSLP